MSATPPVAPPAEPPPLLELPPELLQDIAYWAGVLGFRDVAALRLAHPRLADALGTSGLDLAYWRSLLGVARCALFDDGAGAVRVCLTRRPRPPPNDLCLAYFAAIVRGRTSSVRLLLDAPGVDPSRLVRGLRDLPPGVWDGVAERKKALFNDFRGRVEIDDPDVSVLLATIGGHDELVDMLLTDPRVEVGGGKMQRLCLRAAAVAGYTRTLRRLLAAELAIRFGASLTFHLACGRGNTNCARLLLDDPRCVPFPPLADHLFRVCRRGHVGTMKFLLERMVNCTAFFGHPMEPDVPMIDVCLEEACKAAQLPIVRLLLASPWVKKIRASAVSSVCAFSKKAPSRYRILELLLADPRLDAPSLDSALWVACRNAPLEIAERLLADPRVDPRRGGDGRMRERFADPVACSRYGPQTGVPSGARPLYIACAWGFSRAVRLLLADPRVDPAEHDSIALTIAAANVRVSVVELLLADGRADPAAEGGRAWKAANTRAREAARSPFANRREYLARDAAFIAESLRSDPRAAARRGLLHPRAPAAPSSGGAC